MSRCNRMSGSRTEFLVRHSSYIRQDIMWRYDALHAPAPASPCLLLPPPLSPCDSEPGSPRAVDPLAGGDLRLWPGGDQDPLCDPPEYRTLFDSRGFIFNTSAQALCSTQPTEQTTRPISLPVSPSREQLLTLLNPQSPGHQQLSAVLRPPPPVPPLALLRAVEQDESAVERLLASPRGRFLGAATRLHGRLLDLDTENEQLLQQGCILRLSFEELLTDTDYLLSQTHQLQQELRDVLYLNDLLWLLRGRLERVSRRRWPFLAACVEDLAEINLVI